MNCVYYKSSTNMSEIRDNSIDLIITSPPYFNIKDYSKDGYQEKKHSKFTKKIMLFIGVIVLIIVAISFMRVHNENRLTITTKSSLVKIIEINKLSTIEYTYNAIVTKYKNDEVKDDNVEYYVAYNGKVTAGIDFNEINIDVDYKE